jgi:hypothetical protein
VRRQRHCDGIAAAAVEIEHSAAGGQQAGEEFDPPSVGPGRRAPISVPVAREAFIVADDQVGEVLVRRDAGSFRGSAPSAR